MDKSILSEPMVLKKRRALGFFIGQRMCFRHYNAVISGRPNLPELEEINGVEYNPCPFKKGEIVLLDLFLDNEGYPVVTGKLVVKSGFNSKNDLDPKKLKSIAISMHKAIAVEYPLRDYLFPCNVIVEKKGDEFFFNPVSGE